MWVARLLPSLPSAMDPMREEKSHMTLFWKPLGGERVQTTFSSRNPYGPGLKRVSKTPPPHLSPADCLRFLGLKENEVTHGLFYLAENYERLFEGRIIAVNLAKKWISNLYKSIKPIAAGEELNENNRTGEFECVPLQYFPIGEIDDRY
jgi:hypothetical protein